MSKPLRILLVEDNPGDADLIREMLPSSEDSDFRVHRVARLADAVSYLREKQTDLALLDLDLPDCSGIDTVRQARKAAPKLPIVVLTGNHDEGMGIAAVQDGAQDFLVKGQTHHSHLSRVIRYAVQRHCAEEKMRESERLLRSTLDALSAHIAIIDASGQILAVNKAWREFTCTNNGHVLRCDKDTNYFDACRAIEYVNTQDALCAKVFSNGIRSVLEGQKDLFELEYPMQTTEGRLWFHCRVTPFPGKRDRRVVVAHDNVTERKQAEDEQRRLSTQLRHAYKMEAIGTLAGGIAHDFNNILSSVLGYVELSLMDTQKNSQLENNLQEVYRAGMRAKELVQQILTFARKDKSHIQPTQISTIAKEASKLIRSIIPASIDVQLKLESTAFVMAEPTQMHQIFMNLFTNAAQAMESSGGKMTVTITEATLDRSFNSMHAVFKPGNYIKITVADTGIGIAQHELEKIFDPYFTTKGGGEGTGLGLSVVHGIIQSHGGEIAIESKQNRGTTVTIYLPLSVKKTTADIQITQQLPKGSERILFVDDELPITNLSRQRLSMLGYRVTAVSSSREALLRLSASPDEFDLIITDMTMPNISGDQLAIEAKKIKPHIPIILCTGYSKKISKKRANAIGINAFLMKPVALCDMAETIRKVLG
jgi:signal transduction histidine kinase